MQRPDFNTINLFRKNRLADVMDDIFTQVVRMLVDAKSVSSRCPLRSMCYKGKHNARIIEVNHRNNELRAMARELLTSDEGLMHRSRRPIEPEGVFSQIKYDNHFKRFCYRGKRLVKAEFAAIAVAHNIRKMIAKGYCVCSEVAVG